MKTEKKFTRENGTQYLIQISFVPDSFRETFEYRVNVWTREKGKRNWNNIPQQLSEYDIRKMSWEEKKEYNYKNSLRFVSEEEIMEAKLELWNKLNPQNV